MKTTILPAAGRRQLPSRISRFAHRLTMAARRGRAPWRDACLCGALALCLAAQAHAQSLDWVRQLGGTAGEIGRSIALDGSQNVCVTGGFRGTTDFDPGPGNLALASAGGEDAFVCKLDAAGGLLWARQVGGPLHETGFAVDMDSAENVYVTGRFAGTADFDPGQDTFAMTAAGGYDMFVMKLDAAGDFVWARQMGDTLHDLAYWLTVDAAGNSYFCGSFPDTVDFDPGPGTYELVAAGVNDIVILKLDPAGDFVWARRIGGISDEYCHSIAVDSAGNVYAAGYFQFIADFDPGPGTYNLQSAGGPDVFVLKLDAAGDLVWAGRIGGTASETLLSMALDAAGNPFLAGYFNGTCDFDPGPGFHFLAAAGPRDIFVAKLDAAGNFGWARQMGGSVDASAHGIALDSAANAYVTGRFSGQIDFDPGAGVYNMASAGGRDVFVCKLDSAGGFGWALQMGGPSDQDGYAIAVDASGCAYTTGFFLGTVDFDPGPGTLPVTSIGNTDVFVHKLCACTPTAATVSPVSCDSYVSPSGLYTWTASGTYMDTIPNTFGCDSVITVHLAIIPPTAATVSPVSCDSYVSPSGMYTWTASGTYMDTIPNTDGCDSVITVHLAIDTSTAATISPVSCDAYASPSGLYTWTASGTYMDTIPNTDGCDSVVTVHLTIATVDTSVATAPPVLTANAAGAAYQWLDCGNGLAAIPGETGQAFTATASGSYAVAVTQNGCTDTSACRSVTVVAAEQGGIAGRVVAFPNPTAGRVRVGLGQGLHDGTVVVRNPLGQACGRGAFTLQGELDIVLQGPPGIYLLDISVAGAGRVLLKVVKE